MIRVLVVDDHAETRVALVSLLEAGGGIRVVALAGNGREAVECVKRSPPDVVVMDVQMPDMDGVGAAHRIGLLSPSTRIVLLTMHEDRLPQIRQQLNWSVTVLSKAACAETLTPVVRHLGQRPAADVR